MDEDEIYSAIDDEDEDEYELEDEGELPTRTYCLDLDEGRIVGMIDGKEALQQAIRKAIITPRFKCLIYSDQYGSEVEDAIIVKDASDDFIQSAIEGFIRDALSADTRILEIGEVTADLEGDSCWIFFSCSTIYGELDIEEEVGYGDI